VYGGVKLIDDRNPAWMELIYALKEINKTLEDLFQLMEERT